MVSARKKFLLSYEYLENRLRVKRNGNSTLKAVIQGVDFSESAEDPACSVMGE
jgi:hypothetical protein